MKTAPIAIIASVLLTSASLHANVVFSDDFDNLNQWTLSGNTVPVASGGDAILETASHEGGTRRSIMTTASAYEGFDFTTYPSVSMTLTDVNMSITSGEAPVVFQVGYTPDPSVNVNGLPTLDDSIYFQQVGDTRGYLQLRVGGVATQLASINFLSLSYDSIVMELSPTGWSITLTAAGEAPSAAQTGLFPDGAPSWVGDLYTQALLQQGSAGVGPHSGEITIGNIEVTNIPEASSQATLVGLLTLALVFGIRRKSR